MKILKKAIDSVMRIALVATAIVLTAGCSSKTVIKSSDPETKITIEKWQDSFFEKGLLEYSSSGPFWEKTMIIVSKPGCRAKYYQISKRDDVSGKGFILGMVTYGVGFFWAGAYLPEYNLNYLCEATK